MVVWKTLHKMTAQSTTAPHNRRQYHFAHGFAAATVLFSLALFVMIGVATATLSRNSSKTRQFQETKEQMIAQRDVIWSTLLLCKTIFPAGNNGNGFGVRQQFPATPVDGSVASLVCPGQSPTSIWSGDLTTMSPRALPGFGPWTYVNDATSIRITTTALDAGSLFYQNLMDKVITRIGATQASRSADTLTITLIS